MDEQSGETEEEEVIGEVVGESELEGKNQNGTRMRSTKQEGVD